MKEYEPYLLHILEEAKYLQSASTNLTLEEFLNDESLKRAFVRSLEVIGEAAKKIPTEVREKFPEVEWKQMAAIRDKLIHGILVWTMQSSGV